MVYTKFWANMQIQIQRHCDEWSEKAIFWEKRSIAIVRRNFWIKSQVDSLLLACWHDDAKNPFIVVLKGWLQKEISGGCWQFTSYNIAEIWYCQYGVSPRKQGRIFFTKLEKIPPPRGDRLEKLPYPNVRVGAWKILKWGRKFEKVPPFFTFLPFFFPFPSFSSLFLFSPTW